MCRYFYAHENNTIIERSKIVCTQVDVTNLKDRMQKKDFVDVCTQERTNRQWKFYNLTNLKFSASLHKDVPMGCKDTVIPEPLLKNHNVTCLTFERKTKQLYKDDVCFFRSLALHLHGDEKLEGEVSKNFKFFLLDIEEGDVSKFQGALLNASPKMNDLLQLSIFLYYIDFVYGELIGELCRRSV